MAFYDYLMNYLGPLAGGSKPIRSGFQSGIGLAESFFPPGILGGVVDAPDPTALAALNLQGILANQAFQRDPNIQALIDRRMSIIGGLTPEETTVFREQAGEQLNQGLQTALRSLRARTPGIGGLAPFIGADPTIRSFAEAQRGIERDLIAQNLGLKEQRLRGASDLVRDIDALEAQKRLGATQQFFGSAMGLSQDWLNRQIFNIGQREKERAGQLGLIFGSGGFGAAKEAADRSYELGQKAIEAAKEAKIPIPSFPNFGFGWNQGGVPIQGAPPIPTLPYFNPVPGVPPNATFPKYPGFGFQSNPLQFLS
jgi:hypothetical protein